MRLLIVLFLIFSCKKAPIYPTDELPSRVPSIHNISGISMWGKFVVIDGVMYINNHETGEKTIMNHFGNGKDTSSLRWGGKRYDIEEVIRNITTYSFYKPKNSGGYGRFVLNDDTTKHYSLVLNGNNTSIIEDPINGDNLMGGSSRPFSGQTISMSDSIIAIEIQEVEGSIGGYNCHYWTQLRLKKIKSW